MLVRFRHSLTSSDTKSVVAFNTKFSFYFSNAIGLIKVLTLLLITIAGFVVLGGHTSVEEPTINFHDAFEGKATAYGLTNALYKIIFSYAGFENAFNVVNEVKVSILCMISKMHDRMN